MEALSYEIVITSVPKYGHALVKLNHNRFRRSIRVEEYDRSIKIKLPFLFESDVRIRLRRPDRPDASDPHSRWGDDLYNYKDYFVHTDDFTDRQYVLSDHIFARCKTMKISTTKSLAKQKRKFLAKHINKFFNIAEKKKRG